MKTGNRFTRGILDGSISSIEELKAAYKVEAKLAHPDLADGSGHEDFLRLKNEYDQALGELSRARGGRRREPYEADGRADAGFGGVADDPYAVLEVLLKRGFPKQPRHRKETLRYTYARLRAGSALARIDSSLPGLFNSMEKEAIAADGRASATIVRLLSEYLKAKRTKSDSLLAAFGMEVSSTFPPVALGARSSGGAFAGESRDRPGPAAAAFFRALAGSIGP